MGAERQIINIIKANMASIKQQWGRKTDLIPDERLTWWSSKTVLLNFLLCVNKHVTGKLQKLFPVNMCLNSSLVYVTAHICRSPAHIWTELWYLWRPGCSGCWVRALSWAELIWAEGLEMVQADRGSYTWKWIPLEQVIFITAPFWLSSVIRRIIPSAIRAGLQTHKHTYKHQIKVLC